jgi:hypothetical protein
MKKALSSVLALTLTTAMLSPCVATAQDPVATTTTTGSQTALTNKDVLDMVKTGLSTDIILAKLKASQNNFDTSPSALTELKTNNVPEAVILAMVKGPEPASSVVATVAADGSVNVPDGTEIEVQLTNNASSEDLKVGDIVDFTVVKPVQVGGLIIFEKESSGRARITTAKRAGHWGKAGKLEWAMQDVMSVDGNRVPTRFTQRQIGDSKGGTVAVAAVATTVFLGPVGLLWGLKKGKPSIIPAGNRYSVFVSGDTKIKGKPMVEAAKVP